MLGHRTTFTLAAIAALMFVAIACTSGSLGRPSGAVAQNQNTTAQTANEPAALNPMPVIHVFVALCDNKYQGIVPVSASLGNGDDPKTNLYWGAAFGVKAFFSKSRDWELVTSVGNPSPLILERSVFRHRRQNIFLIADAYRGREISQATLDFLAAAAGQPGYAVEVKQAHVGSPPGVVDKKPVTIHSGGSAELLVYIGHDGLMDFKMPSSPERRDKRQRQAIILACASKQYFTKVLERTGAKPLLWTTNLMAPEAYILSAALEGWIKQESGEQIRMRAAAAYNKYQNCGLKAASNLFATGW
jgi:hypothetical protein